MTENSVENVTADDQEAPEVSGAESVEEQEITVSAAEDKPDRGNKEAARYRTKLREAEAERDGLRASLTQARTELMRAAVTGYKIGNARFNTDALDDAGLDADAIFASGKLDPEVLSAQMTALHESKPYMFAEPKQGNIAPREGATVRDAGSRATAEWRAAFAPERD